MTLAGELVVRAPTGTPLTAVSQAVERHRDWIAKKMAERREALGDLLLERKEYEGSLVHYLQLLKENPDRMDIRYKVGVILLLGGQTQAARQELTTVLAAKPQMLEAKEALGLTYLEEKQYPQAIQIFQEVLSQVIFESISRCTAIVSP